MPADLLAQHVQELRRGTVVLAYLGLLVAPRNGYALLDSLAAAGFSAARSDLPSRAGAVAALARAACAPLVIEHVERTGCPPAGTSSASWLSWSSSSW